MQRIGSFMVVIGILAVILGFFNYVPKILMWIYQWGEGMAWGIKIGLIVLGGLLYLLATKSPEQVESSATQQNDTGQN
ncbi:hypothetical protein [Sphingobacterium spiritivorum]|uniref:hypothetical protein n=1 Tax=Sphingobacterium spiritivorum TaxID=258 RepID=UPI00191AE6FB|nr:hypothetical protein [Sphingobacterium spiritivorum]QQT24734.1 hypothetical protein I6J02_13360 [Sphingobacterium spiritivorum]